MIRTYVPKEQIIHSRNPYIHKFCGCIHLRIGAALACLIWMGLSLYFSILSFQAKSPFFSYIDSPTVLYIFGTINLIFFGISFGTLIPIYLKSTNGIRTSAIIIQFSVAIVLIDTFINTILFIVRRDQYLQWCIGSATDRLDSILSNDRFSANPNDVYNCQRTWESELKFTLLSTILMIVFYAYWAISIASYSVKLRIKLKLMMYNQGIANPGLMLPMMTNIMPTQTGPIVTGTEIVL
ncbi:hypothetical protein EDC96DRAFT_516827 [Choanephora cucurbitarum]|nr:hypothetical protein EDC96DRAFT_516827 [Choanephora cucurbitarum]